MMHLKVAVVGALLLQCVVGTGYPRDESHSKVGTRAVESAASPLALEQVESTVVPSKVKDMSTSHERLAKTTTSGPLRATTAKEKDDDVPVQNEPGQSKPVEATTPVATTSVSKDKSTSERAKKPSPTPHETANTISHEEVNSVTHPITTRTKSSGTTPTPTPTPPEEASPKPTPTKEESLTTTSPTARPTESSVGGGGENNGGPSKSSTLADDPPKSASSTKDSVGGDGDGQESSKTSTPKENSSKTETPRLTQVPGGGGDHEGGEGGDKEDCTQTVFSMWGVRLNVRDSKCSATTTIVIGEPSDNPGETTVISTPGVTRTPAPEEPQNTRSTSTWAHAESASAQRPDESKNTKSPLPEATKSPIEDEPPWTNTWNLPDISQTPKPDEPTPTPRPAPDQHQGTSIDSPGNSPRPGEPSRTPKPTADEPEGTRVDSPGTTLEPDKPSQTPKPIADQSQITSVDSPVNTPKPIADEPQETRSDSPGNTLGPDEPSRTPKPIADQSQITSVDSPGNTPKPTSDPDENNSAGDHSTPVSRSQASDSRGSITATTKAPETTPRPQGPIVVGTQVITKDSASRYIIGTQTLLPGSQIDVDGVQISAAPSGGAIIINPAPPATTSLVSIILIGGKAITAGPDGGFVYGSQTLYPGSAITEGGTVITLPNPHATPAALATQIVLGDATITGTKGEFVLGAQTLTQGGKITSENGDVISLSPDGDALFINAVEPTTQLPTAVAQLLPETISSLEVGGQTLTAGGRITINGEILSLAPFGTGVVVIGTLTVAASPAKTGAGSSLTGDVRLFELNLQAIFLLLIIALWL